MTLSDAEIKRLATKAESFRDVAAETASNSDARTRKALRCYDRILLTAPDAPKYAYYYAQQGILRAQLVQMRSTSNVSLKSLANSFTLASGILSVSKAIELDPGNAEYYRIRGSIRLTRLKVWGEQELESMSQEHLNLALKDFKACISHDPSQQPLAWLHLLALNVIRRDWEEVISLYGQCRPYIQDKEDLLQRSWFGCLAFAFAGDPIEEEDIGILHDNTIRLQWDTLVDLASPVVGRFFQQESNETKKAKVKEILELIIRHEDSWFQRGKYFLDFFGDTAEALKAYDKAIGSGDFVAGSWHNKGNIYKRLHRYDDALECYDKSLVVDPDYTPAKNSRRGLIVKLLFHPRGLFCYLCRTKSSGD